MKPAKLKEICRRPISQTTVFIKGVIPTPIFIGINSSRNPGFPVETGAES
jgi:hypothetical protein